MEITMNKDGSGAYKKYSCTTSGRFNKKKSLFLEVWVFSAGHCRENSKKNSRSRNTWQGLRPPSLPKTMNSAAFTRVREQQSLREWGDSSLQRYPRYLLQRDLFVFQHKSDNYQDYSGDDQGDCKFRVGCR